MTTWAKIKKGDRIELKGREYVVAKVKAKGKRAKVTVAAGGSSFTSEVKLKDTVTLAKPRDKRHDDAGWYVPTKAERKASKRERHSLPAGDPTATEPPKKPGKDPWTTPRDRIEAKLDAIGARLVGEATDENVGYYVPPVDIETVTAHWMVFHEDWLTAVDKSPAELVELHTAEHADGVPLKVNHWHTETRPKRGA